MADLPTNFLDDILSDSMGGKRRFKITRLDGTSEEVTIEDISKYDQVGSTFGAGDINKTNQAVNEKFDSVDVVDPMLTTEPGFAADAYQTKLQFDAQNKNMGGLRFGVDGDGNYGYYGADDSLIPFKSVPKLVRVRTNIQSMSYGETEVIFIDADNQEIRYKLITNNSGTKIVVLDALEIGYNNVKALIDGVKYRKSDSSNSWIALSKGSSFKETVEVGINNTKTFMW